jgi:hypothetical protein
VWQPRSVFWLGVELGVRYTDAGFEPLEPWIEVIGLSLQASVGLPNNVVVSWNYNRYGTKFQHFSFAYRWSAGRNGVAAGRRGGTV